MSKTSLALTPSDVWKLLGFFWQYLRRYMHWAVASTVAVVAFGITSAAMLGLIHPLFEEVLLAGPEEVPISIPGLAVDEEPGTSGESESTPTKTGWLGNLEQWSRERTESVKEWSAGLYDGLKEACGIREGNRFRSPLYFSPLLFALVMLLKSLSAFLSGYGFQRIGLAITTDIRNTLYRRIIHQSMRFHTEHPSGELYSRVISDVTKLQQAVSSRGLDLLQQPIIVLVCIIVLLSIHLPLALICLVVAPAFVYVIARFGLGMRRTSHRSQERMADLSGLLTEGIRGNRVVKAFNMEEFECERFERATARHLRVNLRAQILANISSPVIESLAAIGGSALIVYVGLMIRAERLTLPLFIQFLTTLIFLYDPIRKLNRANLVVQDALAAVQRVVSILEIPNDIEDQPVAEPLETVTENISFVGVSFAYGETQVLEDFDLEIKSGEVVALVGPSGAGKSTVVNLLPRFFDPASGRITIDGIDLKTLPLKNLRSLIGIVTQDTVLFNDTVRNNIAYGRSDLSLERVREAAAAAYADEFIMKLERGYDTVIGESGHQLSGGQRQRLAIARALLKNAPILILDEATSHLDTESELEVQRAIYNLMHGRTALVIAHRLSTVTRADRILVMDSGRIVEQGSHQELLELRGAYKRLYDLQFRP